MNTMTNMATSDMLTKPLQPNEYDVFPEPPKQTDMINIANRTQCDENGHKVMEFYTDYGTQRVSIDGDLSNNRPVMMTYHDIGINHNGCFLSFFNMLKAYDPKFRYFNIVHIDAPQHHHCDTKGFATSLNGEVHDNEVEAFDLLELSTQIEEIRSKLGIDRFIAFGVGAACNILTYYAMNYSQRLRGMILLNGLGSGPSWREWIFDAVLGTFGNSYQTVLDSFNGSLLTRYFPKAMSNETYDYFLDEFQRIDRNSAIKYFRGFVRRQEFNKEQLKKIKTKSLVLCGEFSRVKDETIAFQKIMPRQLTTFVLMRDTGFLLTESNPQKLCSSIDLFVQSLGLTTISLQRKYGKIEEENYDGQDSVATI